MKRNVIAFFSFIIIGGAILSGCSSSENDSTDLTEALMNDEVDKTEENYLTELEDTFIKINLTEQYLQYIIDGDVVIETPIVSGHRDESPTPEGDFSVLSMSREPGFQVPHRLEPDGEVLFENILYHMQITEGGIGIYHAPWHPYFGRERWTYLGSGGCIHLPLDVAAELFYKVSLGTPIVIRKH